MPNIVPFANIPAGIGYGTVHAEVVSFEADGSDWAVAPDGIPDEVPCTGKVIIRPTVGVMRWPLMVPPRLSPMAEIVCPIIGGTLFPPGTTEETAPMTNPGCVLVASDQPYAQPSRVQYEVRWQLDSVRIQPSTVTIDIPADGVVDLASVVPSSPETGVVLVVSHEDRERAEAAADLVAAASAGVVAPGHTVSWSGGATLPEGAGWVEATLTANTTVHLTARGATAEIINLLVIQDATGSRTLTIPGAQVSFGVPVVLSTAPGAIDLLSLIWTGSRWLVLPGALNLKAVA